VLTEARITYRELRKRRILHQEHAKTASIRSKKAPGPKAKQTRLRRPNLICGREISRGGSGHRTDGLQRASGGGGGGGGEGDGQGEAKLGGAGGRGGGGRGEGAGCGSSCRHSGRGGEGPEEAHHFALRP
jgi:hypothetical protein